jgi:hypothetical protein
MAAKIEYERSGPFFDKIIRDEIIHRYCEHTENTLGEMGLEFIQAYLPTVYNRGRLKTNRGGRRDRVDPHPGLYESSIHTERATVDHLIITDTPVVYGPWLEGVGSRNFPATRFRGYHTFRKITRRLDVLAEEVGYAELTPYVEELNA